MTKHTCQAVGASRKSCQAPRAAQRRCAAPAPHTKTRTAVRSVLLWVCICSCGRQGSAGAPIMRDLTTSTGEPTQTARKPAPRPATTCVGRLSVNRPVEMSDDFICAPALLNVVRAVGPAPNGWTAPGKQLGVPRQP